MGSETSKEEKTAKPTSKKGRPKENVPQKKFTASARNGKFEGNRKGRIKKKRSLVEDEGQHRKNKIDPQTSVKVNPIADGQPQQTEFQPLTSPTTADDRVEKSKPSLKSNHSQMVEDRKLTGELFERAKLLKTMANIFSKIERPSRIKTGDGAENIEDDPMHLLAKIFPAHFEKILKENQELQRVSKISEGSDALRSSDIMAIRFIKLLRAKVHASGDLDKLKNIGIPDQRQMMTVVLPTDTSVYDFGGNLRHYYSSVLRKHIPNNMLERYRGASRGSTSLQAIEILGVGPKSIFQEKLKERKLAARRIQLSAIEEVAVNDAHKEYLRKLADNQPVCLPLTLVHDMAKEVLPMVNHVQAFYNKTVGPSHECTEQASSAFIHLLNRVITYNNM